jgi:hypothetical protein
MCCVNLCSIFEVVKGKKYLDKTNILQHLLLLKIIHSACHISSNSFLNYCMPYIRTPFQILLQDKLFIPYIKKYLERACVIIELKIISVVIFILNLNLTVFILSYFMGHEKFFKKQTKLGFTAQDIL